MNFRLLLAAFTITLSNLGFYLPCSAASNHTQSTSTSPVPNSQDLPTQILRTGINLDMQEISPNSRQLAEIVNLTAVLQNIQVQHDQLKGHKDLLTFEDLRDSHLLTSNVIDAMQIIQETNLAIDFTLAEISAEQQAYSDVLSNYQSNRDRAVLKTNALSFITNGILWAVAEGLDIPTYRYPRLSIPSGTNGILAGMVPSVASMYALYQLNGKRTKSESDPNMLAKLFDYPTTPEVEYPKCVWQFLNLAPAEESSNKTRRDLIIDRWIADKNIPNFTDRHTKDLDIITASIARPKGLSIANLNLRQIMLQQLGAEILKMKRFLLELSMVVRGEKRI